MPIDPSTIKWDSPAPQQPAGVSASAGGIDPGTIKWDAPKAAAPGDYDQLVVQASTKYGLDPRIARAVLQVESGGNPNAVSPKGAGGLMQLMPSTAAELGVKDVNDPAQNIDGGVRYLKKMIDANNGNLQLGLAAYNAGLGNVQKHKGIPPFKETQDYVRKVMAGMGDEDVPFLGGVTGQAPQAPAPEQPSRKGDLSSTVARTAMGFNRGFFQDVNEKGKQLAGLVVPDPVERFMDVEGKTINERVAESEAAYQQKRAQLGGEGVDLGRLGGDILTPPSMAAGISGAVPGWVAKFGPKVQATIMAALRGGVAGGMQPVDTSKGDTVLGTTAQQVGLGAALGPVAEGAGRLVTKGVGKLIGAKANELTPEATNALALARQNGVNLSAGDIAPENKIIGGIEGVLENTRIPGLSMSGFRKAEQLGGEAAARKLRDQEFGALQKMTYMGEDRLRALAGAGGTRSAEARKIVDMIDNAGTDERAIMQASGNLGWLQKKLSADKLYNEVAEIAGDKHVAPTSTLDAIDRALKEAGDVVDVDQKSISDLARWRDRLTNGGVPLDDDPIEAAVRQFEGTPPDANVVPNTYTRMRAFRSDLRKRIDSATTNETTDSSKLFLKNIAAAVEKDMDDFANATPNLREANARAQSFYKRHVAPYQKKKLAGALTADNPDQIYGAFIRAQAEGRGDYAAKELWKALDQKGRQAVRYGIVRQSFDNALEDGRFSPDKFKKALESTEYKEYFRDSDSKARVDGVVKLMGLMRRASPEHLEKYSPMLGGTLGLGSVGLGTLAVGPANMALGLGTAGFLRWIMTSDAGKRVLFSVNALSKNGSKAQVGAYLDDLMRQFNAAAGTAAGAEAGKPGTVVP